MAEQRGIPAFGLTAPSKPLLPQYTPLRSPLPGTAGWAAEESARRRQQREREERVARELTVALEEWRRYFDAAEPVAQAGFRVHAPEAGYDAVVCSECEEHNGYEDTQQVEWPCRTFTAMKAAADG